MRAEVYVDCIHCKAVIKSVNLEVHMLRAHNLEPVKNEGPDSVYTPS